jgi:hypothetical protein
LELAVATAQIQMRHDRPPDLVSDRQTIGSGDKLEFLRDGLVEAKRIRLGRLAVLARLQLMAV